MRRVEARDLALINARGRMVIGAALVLAPRLIGPMWIGDAAGGPVVKMMSRALGARDLALGLGTAVALDRGAPVRGWLEGAALADGMDLVASLMAGSSIPPGKRRRVAVIAAVSMVGCAVVARELDPPPAAHEVSVPEAHLTGHS
jgi:hypothetical protein